MGLTGKTRYRTQRRFLRSDVLVLQVEYTYMHMENMGSSVECEEYTAWRDATLSDLTEGKPNEL